MNTNSSRRSWRQQRPRRGSCRDGDYVSRCKYWQDGEDVFRGIVVLDNVSVALCFSPSFFALLLDLEPAHRTVLSRHPILMTRTRSIY